MLVMTIAVYNPTRRPKTFDVVGGATVALRQRVTTKDKTRLVKKEVPESVTVLPGCTVTGLPDACAAEARARGLDVIYEGAK